MKKRRASRAPQTGLEYDLPLPAVGLAAAFSAERKLSGQVVSAMLADVEEDAAGTGLVFDFDVPPPGGTVDPAFDPWQADLAAAAVYGSGSPEMGAWMSAQAISARRENIENDGRLLLEVAAIVLDRGLRAPDWLAVAFRKRLTIFQHYETASLDRAFGLITPNDRKLKALRVGRELRGKVHAALLEKLRADPDRSIGIDLFEEVGQQFEIGKTLCTDLYNLAVTEDGAQTLVAFKRVLRFENGIPPK